MKIKYDKNTDHVKMSDINDYVICNRETGFPEFVDIYADRGKDDTEFVMKFTWDEFEKFRDFINEIYYHTRNMMNDLEAQGAVNFVFKDYKTESDSYNK